MLSYQHGYHAGNPADVFKHAILLSLLEILMEKPRAISFIDSHAGRGLYDLRSMEANKTGEYKSGIANLFKSASPPSWALGLVKAIQTLNEQKHFIQAVTDEDYIQHYPLYAGSILLAARKLPLEHYIEAMELHPQEYVALKESLKVYPHVHLHKRDSFEGIKALLPPRGAKPRRGVILIDPPYEIKTDFITAADAIIKLSQNWIEGVGVLWYPCLADQRELSMVQKLMGFMKEHHIPFWNGCAMMKAKGHSLIGSGIFITFPPFGLEERLNEILRGWEMIYGC